MSGKLRNIERGRERQARKTVRCAHCLRLRRPEQVWTPAFDSEVCVDEAACIKAAKERATRAGGLNAE